MNRATHLAFAALLVLSTLAFTPSVAAAPTIANVSPTTGSTNGGTPLNITGGGFQPGAIVQLVGTTTTTPLTNLVVGATSIKGTTPPTPTGAPGAFQVRVTNPDGSSTLSGVTFTYTAAPALTVSAVSPSSGPSTGGTTLVISGTGFSAAVKPAVTIAGVPAVVQSATPTSLIVVTGAKGNAASGAVTVQNPDGSAAQQASQPFTYIQAPNPSLSTMFPTSGDANGGVVFTLTGSGFAPGATVRFIKFGNSVVRDAANVGFVSSTQLTGRTPPLPADPNNGYTVTVVNPDGQPASLDRYFTVGAGPSGSSFAVTSIEPRSGPSSGGTPVILGGVGFANGPGLRVRFGANEATEVKWVSPTQVNAITPPCTASGPTACSVSNQPVVINPDGTTSGQLPLANAFTFKRQVVITGVFNTQTNSQTVDTSGTNQLRIDGSGFVTNAANCQVFIGGVKAEVVNPPCSDSTVTVRPPAGVPGPKDVQLISDDGRTATLQGGVGYTLPPVPSIDGLSLVDPSDTRLYQRESLVGGGLESDTNGGGILRINGHDFIATKVTDPITGTYRYTSPVVTIRGVPAPVVNYFRDTASSPDHLEVIVPPIPHATVPSGTDGTNAPCQSTGPVKEGTEIPVPTGPSSVPPPPQSDTYSPCVGGDIKLTNLDGQTTSFSGRKGRPATGSRSDTMNFDYVLAGAPDGSNCSGSGCPPHQPLTTGGMLITAFDAFTGVARGTTVANMGQSFFAPTVKMGSTPVQALSVNNDGTLMAFVTPPRTTAGAVDIAVTNPDGQALSLTGYFSYTKANAPTFVANSLSTAVGSSLGSSGGTGNDLVISSTTQTGFTAGMTVTFDQTPVVLHYPEPCTPASDTTTMPRIETNCFSGATQGNAGNLIRVRVPGHPEGTVNVRITALDGQTVVVNNAYTFQPENAPVISAVSPQTAPGVGGNVITITGSGFATGATTSGVTPATPNSNVFTEATYLKPTVKIDTTVVDPRNVTFANANQLRVVLPNHPAGTVTITVTNPDRKESSVSSLFRYLGTQTDVKLTPVTSGTQNGGTLVGFTGKGFDTSNRVQAPVVFFGNRLATSVAVASTTSGLAVTPDGPAGAVALVFVDQDGQTLTIPRGYTYTTSVPPSFTSIAPLASSVNGGALVTLKGSNFAPRTRVCLTTLNAATPNPPPATSCTPETALTTTQFIDTQTLRFTTPSSPPGPVDILVVNPVGEFLRIPGLQSLFYYSQAPSPIITSVTPSSGDVTGGTPVTLSGANFASGAIVTFDNVQATNVTFGSSSSLTAKTPAHSRGPVSVTVTVPGGLSYTLTPGFTYTGNATVVTNTTTDQNNPPPTTTGPGGTTTTAGPGGTTTTTGSTGGPAVPLTSDQIIAANKEVEVVVTRDGDDNIVSFTLPLSLPATAQGVQIFRSNSPFVLLTTLDRTSVDFQSRSYLDGGAPLDSKYLVTIFYANGQGKASTSPDEIPGFSSLGDGVSSNDAENHQLTLIGYILVVVLAVFLAVLLVVLVVRGRRPPAQEAVMAQPNGSAPAAGAPAGDADLRHSVNCPNCGSIFEAYGPKPLRMECPTCGKAGVLR